MATPADLKSPVLAAAAATHSPPSVAARGDHTTNGLTFCRYLTAGSVAGMAEHMAMFPFDTLKTRMQMLAASSPHHSLVARFLASILRSEGPSGLYRGIAAMGLGAGPAHAVYFAVYEVAKHRLGAHRGDGRHHPLIHAASGVLATMAMDTVITPMDVVKQRLQLAGSPYLGVRDCVARMIREEGFRAFYASYRTTIIMNAPFTAVQFATYEAVKKVLSELRPESASEEGLLVHVAAGGAAGALASAITTPLDVVKTRLQCQGVCGAEKFKSSSILTVMRKIVAKEGPRALIQGLKPRVMFHAPAAAICWATYEAVSRFLRDSSSDTSQS